VGVIGCGCGVSAFAERGQARQRLQRRGLKSLKLLVLVGSAGFEPATYGFLRDSSRTSSFQRSGQQTRSTFWSPSSYFSRLTVRSFVCLDYDPFVVSRKRGGLFAFPIERKVVSVVYECEACFD